jgi:hydrogenase expression/formation protein HypD
MKYVEEFRSAEAAQRLAAAIRATVTRTWTIMEICGGQTHSIVRFGVDGILPDEITLVHGPGCPVCVTPAGIIDAAIEIAGRDDAILCSFGDMLRVPGTGTDLLDAKAGGGDVRMVYSPLDALKIARAEPDKQVVFFAVGFETTAPPNAAAAVQARHLGIENFSLLVSQVLVPPAMEAILSSPTNRVQGFLAAGHVCTVMGYDEYGPLAQRYGVPIVVTGFEPIDLLEGIHGCVTRLEKDRAEVANAYPRAVRREGNPQARKMIETVFRIVDREWRGIGTIPQSGLDLAEDWAEFDAVSRFGIETAATEADSECISGLILQGLKKPGDCPVFGGDCTPEHPMGATMVSSEGACAAYHRYRRVGTGGARSRER